MAYRSCSSTNWVARLSPFQQRSGACYDPSRDDFWSILMAEQAPDPARSYERAKPEAESGMGRMDNNKATPTKQPDRMEQAVTHRQKSQQINADDDASPNARPPGTTEG